MKSLLVVHLPYTLLHVVGFFILTVFDQECTSSFGSRIQAFGDCTTGAVAIGFSIWISFLAGTLMYMSFYFIKLIFDTEYDTVIQPNEGLDKKEYNIYKPRNIFLFGLITLIASGIFLVLLDTFQFNIFKIRGITFMIHIFLCHLIIAYAFTKKIKLDLSVWLIYFGVVLLSFTFVPSKIPVLFFLLNLMYYFYDDYKGRIREILIPSFLFIIMILIIYVFTIATRDYGTVAFENISLLGEYMNTIIMKAFVRVTLFEPTILTSSFTNLEDFRASSNFLSDPRGYVQFVQLYFQNYHGYNLERFGYAVGLPMIFFAEFGLPGVVALSFITTLFFHLVHIAIKSIISSPVILFIPIYLITMSDAGSMVIIFLVSLFMFIFFKRISG